MAILPVRLCRIFRRSFFFLFPFGKCPLALIALIILLNHWQQTPCQRLIYKLWNLSGVNIIHIINRKKFCVIVTSYPILSIKKTVLIGLMDDSIER